MKEKYLRLIDQIITGAEKDDRRLKDYWLLKNKACRSEGDGFVLFHLRALKDMIENSDDS
jgi:hypothetical protein